MTTPPGGLIKCWKCCATIHAEIDDMITCGGMFPVWFESVLDGNRQMSCPYGGNHEPAQLEKFA